MTPPTGQWWSAFRAAVSLLVGTVASQSPVALSVPEGDREQVVEVASNGSRPPQLGGEAPLQRGTGVIAEELFARITVKDRLETAEDAERVAVLIADGVWYRFEIRERSR